MVLETRKGAGGGGKHDPATAWCERAGALARLVWDCLVNRVDAYTPPRRRGQEYTRPDGSKAKVPTSFTRKGRLTIGHLTRHFRSLRLEHVLGLHTTRLDNRCCLPLSAALLLTAREKPTFS
jgi:hypothetical protein